MVYPRTSGKGANAPFHDWKMHHAPHASADVMYWRQRCRVSAGAIGAVALGGATPQLISMHTAFPNNTFPPNVMRSWAYWRHITPWAGGLITNVQVEVGDAGDTDGLVTLSTVFGAGGSYLATAAAAEYIPRPERTFVPHLRLTITGGVPSDLTAGEGEMVIMYQLLPEP